MGDGAARHRSALRGIEPPCHVMTHLNKRLKFEKLSIQNYWIGQTTKILTIVYSETGKVLLSFEKLMTKWEPAKRVTSHKYLRVWQKLAPGSRGKTHAMLAASACLSS